MRGREDGMLRSGAACQDETASIFRLAQGLIKLEVISIYQRLIVAILRRH